MYELLFSGFTLLYEQSLFFLSPSNERARNENDHARDRRWVGDWRNLSTRGFAPLTKSEEKKRDCPQSIFTLMFRIFVCQVREGSILVGFTVVPTSGGRDLNEFADDITAKVRAVQLLSI